MGGLGWKAWLGRREHVCRDRSVDPSQDIVVTGSGGLPDSMDGLKTSMICSTASSSRSVSSGS
jgi:hypothetical protein